MSIIICNKCDKRVDIDYEEFHDLDDFKIICNHCFEEEEEIKYLLYKIDIMIESNQIGV